MTKKLFLLVIFSFALSVSSATFAEEAVEADAQIEKPAAQAEFTFIPTKKGLWEYSMHLTRDWGQKYEEWDEAYQVCAEPIDHEKMIETVPANISLLSGSCPYSTHYERLSEYSERLIMECISPVSDFHFEYRLNHESDVAITASDEFRFRVRERQGKLTSKTSMTWLRECQEGDKLYSDALKESREMIEYLRKENPRHEESEE